MECLSHKQKIYLKMLDVRFLAPNIKKYIFLSEWFFKEYHPL